MAIPRAYRSGTLPPAAVRAIDSPVVTSIDMSGPPLADRVGTVSSGDVSSAAPSYLDAPGSLDGTTGARTRVRDVVSTYFGLTKPRIIELLLVTTVPAMFLAA